MLESGWGSGLGATFTKESDEDPPSLVTTDGAEQAISDKLRTNSKSNFNGMLAKVSSRIVIDAKNSYSLFDRPRLESSAGTDGKPLGKWEKLLSQATKFPHLILARKAFFSSGIRYARQSWTEERNREVFGAHSQPYGHGYSFVLEVRVEGERDPVSGLVVNLTDVERVLSLVVKQLDRQHLAYNVPAFANRVPTLENIAQFCFAELQNHLGHRLAGIRLRQGEDDWVDLVATQ